ncbi:hypothetical protein V6N13_064128 [Hibiscus sabdariffa]
MPGFQPLLVVLQLALETERHSNISIEVEYVPHLVGKEVLDLQTRSCGNIGRDGQHLRKDGERRCRLESLLQGNSGYNFNICSVSLLPELETNGNRQ